MAVAMDQILVVIGAESSSRESRFAVSIVMNIRQFKPMRFFVPRLITLILT